MSLFNDISKKLLPPKSRIDIAQIPFNQNFYNMGIPLIILDSWNDLINLTINDLHKINKKNLNKNYEIFVDLNFWKSQIQLAKS